MTDSISAFGRKWRNLHESPYLKPYKWNLKSDLQQGMEVNINLSGILMHIIIVDIKSTRNTIYGRSLVSHSHSQKLSNGVGNSPSRKKPSLPPTSAWKPPPPPPNIHPPPSKRQSLLQTFLSKRFSSKTLEMILHSHRMRIYYSPDYNLPTINQSFLRIFTVEVSVQIHLHLMRVSNQLTLSVQKGGERIAIQTPKESSLLLKKLTTPQEKPHHGHRLRQLRTSRNPGGEIFFVCP